MSPSRSETVPGSSEGLTTTCDLRASNGDPSPEPGAQTTLLSSTPAAVPFEIGKGGRDESPGRVRIHLRQHQAHRRGGGRGAPSVGHDRVAPCPRCGRRRFRRRSAGGRRRTDPCLGSQSRAHPRIGAARRPASTPIACSNRRWSATGSANGCIGLPRLHDCRGVGFDTRYDKPKLLTGSAARSIQRGLHAAGFAPFGEPHSFVVTGTAGPLAFGEIERAREWGEAMGHMIVGMSVAMCVGARAGQAMPARAHR